MQARPQQIERLCDAWLAVPGNAEPTTLVRTILPAIAELLGAAGAGVAFGDGSGFIGAGELGASGSAELAAGADGVERIREGTLIRTSSGVGRQRLVLVLRFSSGFEGSALDSQVACAAAAAQAIGRAVSRLVPAEERRFGDFELLALLDVGGMAEVHLARRLEGEGSELIALKRIRSHLAADPGFVELFIREAATAAALEHENVVRILEYGAEGSRPYLAMELLSGASVARLLERATALGVAIPPAVVLTLALDWSRGLAAAHDRGVVHCDVSPQNHFVTFDGVGKVLDFGVARAAGLGAGGEVRGKLGYLAPELLAGATAAPPADVFGLASSVHDLLRGGAPLTERETVRRTFGALDPSLGLDGALGEVLRCAMSPRAEERPASCIELAQALDRAAASQGIGPVGAGSVSSLMRDLFGDHEAAMRRALAGPSPWSGSRVAGHGTVRVG